MGKTLITFVLDRSGSMGMILDATIEAYNAYVEELRRDLADNGGDPIDFTLIQFDSPAGPVKHVFETPIEQVPLLTRETFKPRGGTPLIDAVLETVRALEAAIEKKDEKPKVIVCVQTDGEENSSRSSWSELKELIGRKQAEGWQFNFMGAGIDAYQQSARMGLSTAATMSYDSTDLGATRAAFAASATNAGQFRRGVLRSTSYTASQKAAAGDAFDPDGRDSLPLASAISSARARGISSARSGLDLSGGKKEKKDGLTL